MTVHCPDCLDPVNVAPNTRDGRCSSCRPSRRKPHSKRTQDFHTWARLHNRTEDGPR